MLHLHLNIHYSCSKMTSSYFNGCTTTLITNKHQTLFLSTKSTYVGRRIWCHNGGSGLHRPSASTVLRLPEKNVVMKPFTSENVTTAPTTTIISPALLSPAVDEQIGIVNFLRGKNYFVTGATGFLAKVLLEKMLRTQPDVGKIYLLIKAKDERVAMDRLKNDIICSELFKCLQQKHGKSYENFMMSKLIPVAGDISKPGLGMDSKSVADIVKQIDVIVSSAATTTFDERFDVALNTNTRGPARLMAFAKKCKKLCLFLHVSTAYANGEREGVIAEKPFLMGQSIAGERIISESSHSHATAPSLHVLDLDYETKLASEILQSVDEKEATQTMKELGLERARKYGWQNVYVFSKAMGEMVINSMRGEIPVVIVRPSVVESTYAEPFPGWIQGNRMLDPLILNYGKGKLPGFSVDPNALIDVVPADMVVNAIIASMAKHGIAAKSELNVYHLASSVVNPLSLYHLFKFSCDHFSSFPLTDARGKEIDISEMKFLSSVDEFSSYISNEIVKQSMVAEGTNSEPAVQPRTEKLRKKKVEHLVHLAELYEPYMFYQGWFDNGNTMKLNQEMSAEEMRNFGFDVKSVNWRHYLMNIHIPGFKRHVLMMKEIAK